MTTTSIPPQTVDSLVSATMTTLPRWLQHQLRLFHFFTVKSRWWRLQTNKIGLEYDDYLDKFEIEVGPYGKIGLTTVDNDQTRAWGFFHRLWGHHQDSRRAFADQKHARVHSYIGSSNRGWDVSNNLVDSRTNYQTSTTTEDGKHGRTIYDIAGAVPPKFQPWKILNDNDAVDTSTTWGNGADWGGSTTASHINMGLWDSSWELGEPALSNSQVDQRWFEG